MPRLSEGALCTVFFVYPSEDEAREGLPLGGSGFFVAVPLPDDARSGHVYAVSNRHVVFSDSYEKKLGTPAIRVNTKDGKFDVIGTNADEWHVPANGDDLAVRLMQFGPDHEWQFESISGLADLETIDRYRLGLGDEVFSIGRFLDEDGRAIKNHPVARFGSVALMPEVPVKADDAGRFQDSYLVEMRSRAGFSGSPVYVCIDPFLDFTDRPQARPQRGESRRPKIGPWLLGVHWGQLPAVGPDAKRATGAASTSYATAMTGVVPAYRLKQFLLEDPILKEQRRELEEHLAQNSTAATLEGAFRAAPIPEPEANPDHREAFSRLVAAASKAKPKGDRTS